MINIGDRIIDTEEEGIVTKKSESKEELDVEMQSTNAATEEVSSPSIDRKDKQCLVCQDKLHDENLITCCNQQICQECREYAGRCLCNENRVDIKWYEQVITNEKSYAAVY